MIFKTALPARLIAVATLAVGLGACSDTRMVRGYVFDKELAAAIQPGVDNRDSVTSTLGTPTLPGEFNDATWYYVSTTVRVRPVFWPDPKEHRVLAIRFNDAGVVEDITNYDLSHTRTITPVADKTPTRGRELNIFQQIFMNVGRFSGQAPVGAEGTVGPNG
ncbi:outer membrane protein assembly factor BamE [Gimibacter soli]|uniref:Outer membrane protein assembly factor BamE n=1 Tax=Gimibacter soli TaxID=3024400 RepID=A0AAE9XMX1_9PROT|nr:outer membrane protein assembly factor BamE [Gimibacter soli]WCL52987.1 outer membrane protein assembly factor BamE [Gimibacter soli]